MTSACRDRGEMPADTRGGTVCRAALGYAVGGDLRFLSHLDETRLLARALVRAGWPLAYSRGFNPRPRLAILLPRSVGTAADCQVAVAGLRASADERALFDRLAEQMPTAAALRWVKLPAPARMPQVASATYELEIDMGNGQRLAGRIGAILAAESLVVERQDGPGPAQAPTESELARRPARRRRGSARQIDIRPYIERLELDGARLRLVLRFVAQRSARPSEVITILGLSPEAYLHRLRRTAIQWKTEPVGPLDWPAVPARNELGTQEDHGRQSTQEH